MKSRYFNNGNFPGTQGTLSDSAERVNNMNVSSYTVRELNEDARSAAESEMTRIRERSGAKTGKVRRVSWTLDITRNGARLRVWFNDTRGFEHRTSIVI